MTEVVRSSCPGCQRLLNIPAEWAGKVVQCKFCASAMQVVPKPAASVPLAAVPAGVPLAAAAPMWEPLPGEASLPECTAPVATIPPSSAPQSKYVSAFDAKDRYLGLGSYKGPKNRNLAKFIVLAAFVLVFGSGAGVLVYLKPWKQSPSEPGPGGGTVGSGGQNGGGPGGGSPGEPPQATGVFPRRMLAISIHSYLYANPLHNGDTGYALDQSSRTGTDAAVRRLAERWRVPKEQLYHLTDARLRDEGDNKQAKKGDAKSEPPKRISKVMPLKMVIEGTVTQFCETARAQDHIVFLFCGHVIDKKGEIYLVPIEGDFDEVDTLIPLKWLYEKIGACPAQEKVVIFDVCRFHPERGVERPHPGPMTEAMEKALHDSPDGVTVITSCSKGEQALEIDRNEADFSYDIRAANANKVLISGSYFLSMIHAASYANVLTPENRLPAPGDELPVERMTTWMGKKLAEVVHFRFVDRTQTLKATIKQRAEPIPFNPSEPAPPRFEFPTPPPSADPKTVMDIVREIQLPPVKAFREDAPPPSISDVMPFPQDVMKEYMAGALKPGDTPNEFQKAVIAGVEEMRRQRGAGSGSQLPEEFPDETSDQAKAEFRKIQELPAKVEAELDDALSNLEAVADQKEKQTKRWQVHYDYVVAQLKLRICYVNQYNLALANVRSGKLPDRKEGQNGYRLSAEMTLDKNTPPDKKEMFSEARKALTEIAKNHPKTPWALLAKSDRTVAIGLRLTGSSVAK